MQQHFKRILALFSIALLLLATTHAVPLTLAEEDKENQSYNYTVEDLLQAINTINNTQSDQPVDESLTDLINDSINRLINSSINDSISNATLANVTKVENHNESVDYTKDSDDDRLPDCIEVNLGTDPYNADSDDDGLQDYYELFTSLTSPLRQDSNNNSISDGLEDRDADGLKNLDEQALGTHPFSNDTDRDGLQDNVELNLYHTDPLKQDSDEDGLSDDVEKHFNTDPRVRDSDSSGVTDGKKSFEQQFSNASLGVSVDIKGSGMLQKTLKIEKEQYPYTPLTTLSGIVGDFYTVNTTSSFEKATLRFSYDESRLNGSSESSMKLYYFDWEKKVPVEVKGQKLDTKTNTIEATTDRLGTWFIADDSRWSRLNQKQDKKTIVDLTAAGQDTLSAADDTGSDIGTGSPDGGYMLLSMGETYNEGDTVNIHAQVHNTGNANIQSGTNVLVKFYDGDPSNGGTQISSTTITNGIAQGGSQTATIQYTIQHLPVDVYVSVDPLNTITEQSEYNNKAYNVIDSDPESQDSDGDGLYDIEETGGIYVGYPYGYIYTNPFDADADDDGLDDGEEVEYHADTDSFQLISNPNNQDSDNDGLCDDDEYYLGTNPFLVDTDNDNIWDINDLNPLVFDEPEVEPSIYDIAGIIAKGIVFGDMGYEDGLLYWFVGNDCNSPYYFVGVLIRGFIPLSDITDLAQAVLNWDGTSALLSAIGLVPGPGDVVKLTGVIGVFVVRNADDAPFIFKTLSKVSKLLLKYLPDEVSVPLVDAFTSGASTKLKNIGVDTSTQYRLIENGKDLKSLGIDTERLTQAGSHPSAIKTLIENGVDIQTVRRAFNNGYLTNDQWLHTFTRHIDGSDFRPRKKTTFFPTGRTISEQRDAYGILLREEKRLDNIMSDSQVEECIYRTINTGSGLPHPDKEDIIEYTLTLNQYGIREMKVWVDNTGKIVTAFPINGPNVKQWHPRRGWENVP